MLKPKKAFVMAQLNIEKLTSIQWSGIMRAMDAYAQHYHECKVNELSKGAVIGKVCEHRSIMYINSEIGWLCYNCRKFSHDKQNFHNSLIAVNL